MMNGLEKFVQDCVSEIFGLDKLEKCQIEFYQQIAGRLVNVTVELESALGEVNNIIEKVDKMSQKSAATSAHDSPINKNTLIQ